MCACLLPPDFPPRCSWAPCHMGGHLYSTPEHSTHTPATLHRGGCDASASHQDQPDHRPTAKGYLAFLPPDFVWMDVCGRLQWGSAAPHFSPVLQSWDLEKRGLLEPEQWEGLVMSKQLVPMSTLCLRVHGHFYLLGGGHCKNLFWLLKIQV